MTFWARFALAALLMSGCYASHSIGGEAGEHCVSPGPSEDNPCGPSVNRRLPRGVCVVDGELLAFAEGTRAASCVLASEAVFRFEPHHCTPERPKRREVARCGDAAPEVFFASGGRPPFRFDLTEASGAIADRWIQPPAEPWRPFTEATELCDDPYAWCGSPIVLELRQPFSDGCGGSQYTERCTASVEHGQIVLRAEAALADGEICRLVLGHRVATCVVPPLAAGHYEVVDGDGQLLGAIDIPGEQPVGDFEPTCVPFP